MKASIDVKLVYSNYTNFTITNSENYVHFCIKVVF